MTATAATIQHDIRIERADGAAPILVATGREAIAIRAGTVVRIDGRTHAFEADTPLDVAGTLAPGGDYGVIISNDGVPIVVAATGNPIEAGYVTGFHFAPSGCAEGVAGGDGIPAINPHSIWDAGFRPACADPRGMALVTLPGDRRIWVDIYLLAVDHGNGTSRHGADIADGSNKPQRADGKGRHDNLNYSTAAEIYAHHGKQLLAAEEFFAAAYGVEERCSRNDEPDKTGTLDDGAQRFVSRFGLHDATGTMWQWGTDGHPDDPRPSIFGGSWFFGSSAGSRGASLASWPENSYGSISARGRCDHLRPVACAEAQA